MPIPGNRLKLVPYGTIDSAQDWSTALNFSATLVDDSWDIDNLLAVTTALEAFFNTWATDVSAFWSASTEYLGLKAYYYGVAGDVASLSADAVASSPIPGSGSTILPTQCCLVCTTRTGHAGRSYRGRSYMPLTASALPANNEVLLTTATNVANAYQALIGSCNGYTNPTESLDSMTFVVASAKLSSLLPVTSIDVDSRVDIQRRRADKIAPAFTVTKPI
jgi:hypothetical protein